LEFAAGELRFRGARFKQSSEGCLDISYNFLFSPNVIAADDFTIGLSEAIERFGHEYMWVFYEETTEATTGGPKWKTQAPVGVYIERVYDWSDFTQLQL
jgi:hypothetical protein